MFDVIKSNILAPASTRIGSMITGALVGAGLEINATYADWVGTGVAGFLLIGCDLMLAWFRKRSIQSKAVEGAVRNGAPQ